jgi:VWFA-related protein
MRSRAIGAIVALLLTSGAIRGAGQETVFRAGTTLLTQVVTVVDANGQPIEGLAASDFRIVEDGVVQQVAFAEFQRLDQPAPLPVLTATPALRTEALPSVTAASFASAATARPEDRRDRRLLVFYFDMPSMSDADRHRAFVGADRYIASEMSAVDLVALVEHEGAGVYVRQAFTDDRDQLRVVLGAMEYGVDRDGDGIPDPPQAEASDFGQNSGEFNFLRTDRQLAALHTVVSMLRAMPERKTLLYFASGLALSGLDNHAQLSAAVNAALRANVTINPIDTRGLVAEPPLGGANVASPGGLTAFTGQAAQGRQDRFDRSQDTLMAMAGDTGGKAFLNYNDLALGIRRAAADAKSYYILGYYSTRTVRDGRFRRVSVTLPGHPSATLSSRPGYFAEKAFKAFTGADKERQLEDALMLGDPVTEIPLAVEVNYFSINRNESFVPIDVKLPGDRIDVRRNGDGGRVDIDLIGEVKDERGVTVQNLRDRLEVPLTASQVAQLASHPLHYEAGFTLLPGRYTIKLLARDAISGRMGTFDGSFVLPNLNRDQGELQTSSIVLSAERMSTAGTLFRVKQRVVNEAANPLIRSGQRVLPSVTRIFSPDRGLSVLFYAYRDAAGGAGPIAAYVSLFRGDVKVRETAATTQQATGAVVPFEIPLGLDGLAPGTYTCQVTIIDLGRQRTRFWRQSIVVRR